MSMLENLLLLLKMRSSITWPKGVCFTFPITKNTISKWSKRLFEDNQKIRNKLLYNIQTTN